MVAYIPRVGRTEHFRSIGLSSFLFKSTDTDLHDIIRTIEGSLGDKQYTKAAFLNLVGAFNNANTDAIQWALINLGLANCVRSWVICIARNQDHQS